LVPVRTTHGSVRDLWESPIAALLGTESSLSERRNFLRLIPSYVLPLQLVSRITNGYVRGVANDTFSLGILISHIMSGTMLVDAASVESWSPSLGYSLPDSISRRLNLLPSSSIRGFIESLLSHSYDGVDNILSEHIDCFPSWFEKVHTILSMYYMLPSWIDRVAYSLQVCFLFIQKNIQFILFNIFSLFFLFLCFFFFFFFQVDIEFEWHSNTSHSIVNASFPTFVPTF
ncbi:MAG: hypothetical protein Q8P67_29300, partial [archaeon]|nr:hypothetical protein [archaeon]